MILFKIYSTNLFKMAPNTFHCFNVSVVGTILKKCVAWLQERDQTCNSEISF